MKFRLAEPPDLSQLACMRWEYWVEDGSHQAQQSKEDFVDSFVKAFTKSLSRDWYIWCAVQDDLILSHVYIQRIQKVPKPSAPMDAFGYVTNVYTRPSQRGKGIGSNVMKHVKAWAHEEDLEFLVLWPSQASIPFWNEMGFSVDAPLVHEIRPYVN